MSRRPCRLVALALVAVMSLISASCGVDAPSGAGTAGTGGTGGDTTSTDRDTAVTFAACMRDNKVTDFPDPDVKGEFVYGISVSPAVFAKAVDACKDLQPPGTLSADRSPTQQSASLRFARCMRENGVKDFPDPANGEPLVDTTRVPSTDRDGGMTILNAAMETCRTVMAEAAAGQ